MCVLRDMDQKAKIESLLKESASVVGSEFTIENLANASQILADCLNKGNKILICGNGGSFAESQHFAAELVGRFKLERNGLAAIVLGSNTASVTAIANDYSFEDLFKRELEALGKKDDVFVVFSTSGNSRNVIKAVEYAKTVGIKTIGFLGSRGKLLELVDLKLPAQSENTPRIQEAHLVWIHIISELIDDMHYGIE